MGVDNVENHVIALAYDEGVSPKDDPDPHQQAEFQRPAVKVGIKDRNGVGQPFKPCRIADRNLDDENDEHGGHHDSRYEFGGPGEPAQQQRHRLAHPHAWFNDTARSERALGKACNTSIPGSIARLRAK